MADHHATLQAMGLRHIGNALDLPTTQITRIMQVNVDTTVMPLGHAKYGFQVAYRVAVNRCRVNATDQVHTQRQRLLHQLLRPGLNQHAALGKGDQLQIDQVLVALAQRQHGLDMSQAPGGLDIDVAAEIQRTARDAVLDQWASALGDGDGKVFQQHLLIADAVVARRAGAVRAPGQGPQRLVQVHMALHQRWQQQLPLTIDQTG